jgi:TetR/AcrR family transcriptional regulator
MGRAARPRALSVRRAAAAPDPRRIEILKSAAAAFRRRGYHGASVDQIARALRMTKGNLYYYFRDKEEILFVLHDWSVDLLLERLRAVQESGAGPAEKLRRLIHGFVAMIIDELHGTALTLDLEALSPARLRRVIAKRDRFDRGLRDIVRQGMRQGVFAPGDPKLVVFAVLGAVNWIPRWFDPRGPAGTEEVARAFSTLVLDGLAARPAPLTRARARH